MRRGPESTRRQSVASACRRGVRDPGGLAFQGMRTLTAVVRGGRVVLVEDRVDYPDGTELQLDVREPVDELDEEELAHLDAALDAGQREYEATGKTYTAEEVLARVRSGR
jgi:hypothetical protein